MKGDKLQGTKHKLSLELENRLQFERILTNISTRFIDMPAEQIDAEIEDSLRCVCEFLNIDQASLFQKLETNSDILSLTHLYQIPGGPERPERLDAKASFPWVVQKLFNGETVVISPEDLPREAATDKKTYTHFGIKSTIAIPISLGKKEPMGILGYDMLTEKRCWTDETKNQLELVSKIFTNALSRKNWEFELREKEERLNLALDAAEAGVWIFYIDSGQYYASPRARELYGFGPDDIVKYEDVYGKGHPDDRDSAYRAVQHAIQSGELYRAEYRVALPDKSLRWLLAIGKPQLNANGVADRLLGITIDITGRKQMESELKERLKQIEELKLRIENENLYLRKELRQVKGFDKIVGESKAFSSVIFSADQVASTEAAVLILGETGTGKGMVANAIHQMSVRKDRPLVTVNCLALPKNLIESELFGREKGAFTGAHMKQIGRFEVANGGTIFLDEIGEMPLELQSKLLRVLQDGEFERLGSAKTVKVNARVIAATHRDLREEVRERRFREDLFYRLNVFPIFIPPLRQRTDDIPLLVEFFIEKYCRKMGKQIDSIPKATMKMFMEYDWPGNVRELEHVIERSVIITSGPSLEVASRLTNSLAIDSKGEPLMDLVTLEREHILRVLQETGWRIEGSSGAASILKIHPSTLRFRIKKLNIHRPE
jgi:formate hydrogenlyase transcriptional activator